MDLEEEPDHHTTKGLSMQPQKFFLVTWYFYLFNTSYRTNFPTCRRFDDYACVVLSNSLEGVSWTGGDLRLR